jgi:hypothetical protein
MVRMLRSGHPLDPTISIWAAPATRQRKGTRCAPTTPLSSPPSPCMRGWRHLPPTLQLRVRVSRATRVHLGTRNARRDGVAGGTREGRRLWRVRIRRYSSRRLCLLRTKLQLRPQLCPAPRLRLRGLLLRRQPLGRRMPMRQSRNCSLKSVTTTTSWPTSLIQTGSTNLLC